jgi:hypothetical protein
VAGVEGPFLGFALVILPTDYVLGLMTLGRLHQVQAEALLYAQGMNRIRHYFLEVAPDIRRHLVLGATDDPLATLRSLRMGTEGWTTGLLTRNAIVVLINSVVAGVIAGLVAHGFEASRWVVVVVSAVFGLASAVALARHEQTQFRRLTTGLDVEFPAEG